MKPSWFTAINQIGLDGTFVVAVKYIKTRNM